MAQGLEAQFSWTWSKSLDTRSYDPSLTHLRDGNGTIGHFASFRCRESQAELCPIGLRPAAHFQFILDMGAAVRRDRRAASAEVLYRRLVAGLPASSATRPAGRSRSFPAQIRLSSVFQSTVQCNGCSPDEGHVFTNSAGIIQYIDQATRDKLSMTPAGEIGNTGRNFFNLARRSTWTASVSKRFYFRREDEPRRSARTRRT